MKCKVCNAANADGATTCMWCGTPLGNDVIEPVVENSPAVYVGDVGLPVAMPDIPAVEAPPVDELPLPVVAQQEVEPEPFTPVAEPAPVAEVAPELPVVETPVAAEQPPVAAPVEVTPQPSSAGVQQFFSRVRQGGNAMAPKAPGFGQLRSGIAPLIRTPREDKPVEPAADPVVEQPQMLPAAEDVSQAPMATAEEYASMLTDAEVPAAVPPFAPPAGLPVVEDMPNLRLDMPEATEMPQIGFSAPVEQSVAMPEMNYAAPEAVAPQPVEQCVAQPELPQIGFAAPVEQSVVMPEMNYAAPEAVTPQPVEQHAAQPAMSQIGFAAPVEQPVAMPEMNYAAPEAVAPQPIEQYAAQPELPQVAFAAPVEQPVAMPEINYAAPEAIAPQPVEQYAAQPEMPQVAFAAQVEQPVAMPEMNYTTPEAVAPQPVAQPEIAAPAPYLDMASVSTYSPVEELADQIRQTTQAQQEPVDTGYIAAPQLPQLVQQPADDPYASAQVAAPVQPVAVAPQPDGQPASAEAPIEFPYQPEEPAPVPSAPASGWTSGPVGSFGASNAKVVSLDAAEPIADHDEPQETEGRLSVAMVLMMTLLAAVPLLGVFFSANWAFSRKSDTSKSALGKVLLVLSLLVTIGVAALGVLTLIEGMTIQF